MNRKFSQFHRPVFRRPVFVRTRICVTIGIWVIGTLCARSSIAAPDNWLAAVSGDWSDGTKWSLGSPPVGGDDASIPFSGIAVSFNTNSSVNSLSSGADLTILGGSLTGSQANGATPVTINSGTLSLNGGGLSSLTLSPGAGAITVAANGGNSLSDVAIDHDISLELNGYVQVYGSNSTSASISLTGGANGIQLRDGNATLTVTSTGAIHGSGAVFQTFGGATLADNGTITADQLGKTLALNNSFITGSGTLAATGGGILSIGGRLNGTALKANVDATPGSQVIVDGGGLSGTLASSTGSGLSFAGNGGNFIDTATINGDLTFDGAAYAQVYNANTLSGTIHMAGTANGIQLRDGNAVLTVNSSGKIRGFGQVFQTFGGATLANSGTISADTAAQTLALNPSSITGSGTFEAKNGGVLSIGGLLNGSNAVVHVDANPASAVLVNGGGLTGSFAASTGSGISFSGNAGNLIDTATIAADLTFNGNAYAQVYNANTVSGTIHMAGTANGIQLRDGNATLTVTSTGAIHGSGAVFQTFGNATLADNGTITADQLGKTLALNNSFITGSGTLAATGGGILSIGGRLNGTALKANVDATPGSQVIVDGGGLSGTLASSTGSGLSFAGNGGNFIDTATINGDLTFNGAAYAQVYNANTLSGTIHMAGTANGIQLRDGNAVLTVNSSGKIHGYGQVFQTFGGATLANSGTISADTAAQTLALNPSSITGSGTFEAKNGGVLSIGGLLNGNNAVVHVDANPASAVLVNGGGLTGSFAASTGSGISFSGNAGNLIDTATIAADLTFNGNAYAQVYNANTVSGTIHMAGTANGIQLRDGNATLSIAPGGKLHGYGAVFETFGGTHLVNNGAGCCRYRRSNVGAQQQLYYEYGRRVCFRDALRRRKSHANGRPHSRRWNALARPNIPTPGWLAHGIREHYR